MSTDNDLVVIGLTVGAGLLYWLLTSSDNIDIIVTEAKCKKAVNKLRSHCSRYKALGFDCEWLRYNEVALLQLCSPKGYCALFRLNELGMPSCLADLLYDPRILKVGVDPLIDAINLWNSYDVPVKCTLDLRFLAVMTGYKPQNLADMYKQVVGKNMSKNMAQSNWEATTLSSAQIKYAARDALAGIQIFDVLIKRIQDLNILRPYMDTRFIPHYHDNIPRVDSGCVLQ